MLGNSKKRFAAEITYKQVGFKSGKWILDTQSKDNLCVYFFWYTKVSDTVRHEQLWQWLRVMGFPGHIVELKPLRRGKSSCYKWLWCIGLVKHRDRCSTRMCSFSSLYQHVHTYVIMDIALEGFIGRTYIKSSLRRWCCASSWFDRRNTWTVGCVWNKQWRGSSVLERI